MAPPRRKRKGLSAEDRALWDHVTRSVAPLRSATALPQGAAPPLPEPKPPTDPLPTPPAPTPAFPRGLVMRPTGPAVRPGVSVSFANHDPGPVGRPEAGLDRRTADKLRRGRRDPDDRIDLHGMTAERAHAALDGFIARSLAAGHRCVLVITGKGGRGRDPDSAPFYSSDRGVLRQAVPRWLRTGPHAARILNVYAAHRRHGGEGACYVYLKRLRPA